jgi:hypothetical protein
MKRGVIELIDDPRFTEGEQHCGFADPAEAELGPEECPNCEGYGWQVEHSGETRCPTCQPYGEAGP